MYIYIRRSIMVSTTMRVFLLFITVLLATEFANCDDSSEEEAALKETYVGTLEKSIRALIRPKQIAESRVAAIRSDLRQLASGLFLPINTERKAKKKSRISDILNPYKSKIKVIFPGTYWCGEDNISPNGQDLGLFEKTDACCRSHDLCPENILSGENQDGLMNNGIFTRSSCECDTEFYRCLKEANNILATNIAATYFNLLRPQCFQKDYPVINCKKYARRRLIHDKCEEYNYNSTLPQITQWFDNPDFYHLL